MPSSRARLLKARMASTSGRLSDRLLRSRGVSSVPSREPEQPLEDAQDHGVILVVDDDDGQVSRTDDVGPAGDQPIVAMASPEHRLGAIRLRLERRPQPRIEVGARTALDELLPLRGHDPGERPQGDHDVHAGWIEVPHDPADGVRCGVREELAAHDDPRLASFVDLADELAPGLDGWRLAVHHVGPSRGGHDRSDGLSVGAGVVDALRMHPGSADMERRLERGRAGLERTDVDEPRSLRDQEVGRGGRGGHGRRRPTMCSLRPTAARSAPKQDAGNLDGRKPHEGERLDRRARDMGIGIAVDVGGVGGERDPRRPAASQPAREHDPHGGVSCDGGRDDDGRSVRAVDSASRDLGQRARGRRRYGRPTHGWHRPSRARPRRPGRAPTAVSRYRGSSGSGSRVFMYAAAP